LRVDARHQSQPQAPVPPQVTPIASPVIAIDPASERALLGPTTADFLAPLEAIAELFTAPIVRVSGVNRIPETFADQRFFVTALASDPMRLRTSGLSSLSLPASRSTYL
jgi:hypothetical protein